MITSTSNPKIQWIRKLQSNSRARREEQVLITEGVRLCEEALTAGWPARVVLYTADLSERGQSLLDGFDAQGAALEQVSEQVMRSASDTQTPQGILAVLAQSSVPMPLSMDFVFIPDAVRDPGNLGTMLRTAGAAGVGAIFLPPGTVDVYAPKVIRAAMGAHFHLPIYQLNWKDIQTELQAANLRVVVAAAGAGTAYTQADLHSPLALVIGGEAEGAGEKAQLLAEEQVHIPMPGWAESLNAAIAAAILLFEVVRQRDQPSR
jgi:RNA methyltransferase, TrmH family